MPLWSLFDLLWSIHSDQSVYQSFFFFFTKNCPCTMIPNRNTHTQSEMWWPPKAATVEESDDRCLWTPALLLRSTMKAFEVSSPIWTLCFVVILKRAEGSILHITVVVFFFFTEAFICYQRLRAFPTPAICRQFDLFHCRIIRRWPLMFSQDSWRVIDRVCTVAYVSVESFICSPDQRLH